MSNNSFSQACPFLLSFEQAPLVVGAEHSFQRLQALINLILVSTAEMSVLLYVNFLSADYSPFDVGNLQDPPQVFRRICTGVSSELPMQGLLNMRFHSFVHVQWVFTVGLSLSSAVDVLITACLCYYLHSQRTVSLRCALRNILNDLCLIELFQHE